MKRRLVMMTVLILVIALTSAIVLTGCANTKSETKKANKLIDKMNDGNYTVTMDATVQGGNYSTVMRVSGKRILVETKIKMGANSPMSYVFYELVNGNIIKHSLLEGLGTETVDTSAYSGTMSAYAKDLLREAGIDIPKLMSGADYQKDKGCLINKVDVDGVIHTLEIVVEKDSIVFTNNEDGATSKITLDEVGTTKIRVPDGINPLGKDEEPDPVGPNQPVGPSSNLATKENISSMITRAISLGNFTFEKHVLGKDNSEHIMRIMRNGKITMEVIDAFSGGQDTKNSKYITCVGADVYDYYDTDRTPSITKDAAQYYDVRINTSSVAFINNLFLLCPSNYNETTNKLTLTEVPGLQGEESMTLEITIDDTAIIATGTSSLNNYAIIISDIGSTRFEIPGYVEYDGKGNEPVGPTPDKPITPDQGGDKPALPDDKPALPDDKPNDSSDANAPQDVKDDLDMIISIFQDINVKEVAYKISGTQEATSSYSGMEVVVKMQSSGYSQGYNSYMTSIMTTMGMEDKVIGYTYVKDGVLYVVDEMDDQGVKTLSKSSCKLSSIDKYLEKLGVNKGTNVEMYADRSNYRYDADKKAYYVEYPAYVTGPNGTEEVTSYTYLRMNNGKIEADMYGSMTGMVIVSHYVYSDFGKVTVPPTPQYVIDAPVDNVIDNQLV